MLVWTDTETTGLKEREGHLLEVALLVTDDDLVEKAAFSVVCRPVGVEIDFVQMDDFVREMHTKNGLLEEVKLHGVRRHEAEAMLIAFIEEAFKDVPKVATHKCANCGKNEKEHNGGPCVISEVSVKYFGPKTEPAIKHTPLAGSTISFDRAWLREHMKTLEAMFFYRSVDVSSFTEMAKRWAPNVYKGRPNAEAGAAHRALADIRESVNYLRYYRQAGFCGGHVSEVSR